MEDGMNKIQFEFDQHTKADEVLNQIVVGRLNQICNSLATWESYQDAEIMAACKVLLNWMGNPHAQD